MVVFQPQGFERPPSISKIIAHVPIHGPKLKKKKEKKSMHHTKGYQKVLIKNPLRLHETIRDKIEETVYLLSIRADRWKTERCG